MIARLNAWLFAHASGKVILLLLLITIVSFGVMAAVITPAFQEVTEGLRPLDLNFGISAELAYRDLPSYTAESKKLYLWFVIVDYIFPFTAAAFFTMLWAWIFKKRPAPIFTWLADRGVLLVPFLFALLDWLENIGFLIVVFSYPAEYPRVADAAGMLKTCKPFVELLVVVLTVIFTAVAVGKGLRNRARD